MTDDIRLEFCLHLKRWVAWHMPTSDGAPDRHPVANCRGEGREPEDAIDDLREQLDEYGIRL